MRRLRFERPTNHYDERVIPIDEQICALIKERKDISNNNPGYPPFEQIEKWSEKYGLYGDFLKSLFGNLRNEEHYRPQVEPNVFQKHVPVLKSVEKDGAMYTVTFIRQYDNASIIYLHIDSDPMAPDDGEFAPPIRHRFFKLTAPNGYESRSQGSGGGHDHYTYKFVVAPALPENLANVTLRFEECKSPIGEPTGFEFAIGLG